MLSALISLWMLLAVSSKISLYGSCHQICCCFVIFILGVEAVVNFGVVVAVGGVVAVADAVILVVLTAAGVIVVVVVAVSGVIIHAVVTAAGVIVVV